MFWHDGSSSWYRPITGQLRLTFGFEALESGIGLMPVLIGAFAINQIFKDIIEIDNKPKKVILKN